VIRVRPSSLRSIGNDLVVAATLDDVAALASSLDGVSEGTRHGNRTWFVGKKAFAWERPFTKADLRRFGEAGVTPPTGEIVAVLTDGLVEKEAVLAEGRRGVFTMAHFDGYAAVLIELRVVGKRVLRELVLDAWRTVTPGP
jgi:hypothetical protein